MMSHFDFPFQKTAGWAARHWLPILKFVTLQSMHANAYKSSSVRSRRDPTYMAAWATQVLREFVQIFMAHHITRHRCTIPPCVPHNVALTYTSKTVQWVL